jgi:hypothetical protein
MTEPTITGGNNLLSQLIPTFLIIKPTTTYTNPTTVNPIINANQLPLAIDPVAKHVAITGINPAEEPKKTGLLKRVIAR